MPGSTRVRYAGTIPHCAVARRGVRWRGGLPHPSTPLAAPDSTLDDRPWLRACNSWCQAPGRPLINKPHAVIALGIRWRSTRPYSGVNAPRRSPPPPAPRAWTRRYTALSSRIGSGRGMYTSLSKCLAPSWDFYVRRYSHYGTIALDIIPTRCVYWPEYPAGVSIRVSRSESHRSSTSP